MPPRVTKHAESPDRGLLVSRAGEDACLNLLRDAGTELASVVWASVSLSCNASSELSPDESDQLASSLPSDEKSLLYSLLSSLLSSSLSRYEAWAITGVSRRVPALIDVNVWERNDPCRTGALNKPPEDGCGSANDGLAEAGT